MAPLEGNRTECAVRRLHTIISFSMYCREVFVQGLSDSNEIDVGIETLQELRRAH